MLRGSQKVPVLQFEAPALPCYTEHQENYYGALQLQDGACEGYSARTVTTTHSRWEARTLGATAIVLFQIYTAILDADHMTGGVQVNWCSTVLLCVEHQTNQSGT
ncbi:UNVERIFIED_CONTAM: hypothetical protein FKN15_002747 [Acipenser sinensis]